MYLPHILFQISHGRKPVLYNQDLTKGLGHPQVAARIPGEIAVWAPCNKREASSGALSFPVDLHLYRVLSPATIK